MSVKQRIMPVRLAEKIGRNPEYAKKLGITLEAADLSLTGKEECSSVKKSQE